MKTPCDVITDLLPLYHDGVCSEASSSMIEEHLAECETCRSLLERIRDLTVDDYLAEERENVVLHHTRAVKRTSLIVGAAIAGVLAIPILVCLIVNLATGHTLDWFFIVLTSLMTLASVIVVPLVVERNKGLWTLGTFTASLILLLLTCAIYTGGSWFFVAVLPVLFGLSVFFTPYVLYQLPTAGLLARHKGLLAMAADTVLLFAIIVAAGFFAQGSTWLGYWQPALLITLIWLVLPWALFLIIRYLRVNGFTKAGICVICSGLLIATGDIITARITGTIGAFNNLFGANLYVWSDTSVINVNVSLLILIATIVVGIALIVTGLILRNRSKASH